MRLILIGALGNMLAPAARHWQGVNDVQVVRVLDRGKSGELVEARRLTWQACGAELVSSLEQLVGVGDFDGVVICAGKNGDDVAIIQQLMQHIGSRCSTQKPFVVHMSTVSPRFVAATETYCRSQGVVYVNYPLTGGVTGAESANMLILCSGDLALYEHMQPVLSAIGKPRYFGSSVARAAEVKLIGHTMVFHNLLGVCSAINVARETASAELFQFLGGGAGGSFQCQFVTTTVLENNQLSKGFLLQHAVVDALYLAELMCDHRLPTASIIPILLAAFACSFVLKMRPNQVLCTQAIAEIFSGEQAVLFDGFLAKHMRYDDLVAGIRQCAQSLPAHIEQTIQFQVEYSV